MPLAMDAAFRVFTMPVSTGNDPDQPGVSRGEIYEISKCFVTHALAATLLLSAKLLPSPTSTSLLSPSDRLYRHENKTQHARCCIPQLFGLAIAILGQSSEAFATAGEAKESNAINSGQATAKRYTHITHDALNLVRLCLLSFTN